MKEQVKQVAGFFMEKKVLFSWRRIWLTVIVIVALFGLFFISLLAYAKSYDQRTLPGLTVGDVPVGGLERGELKELLQEMVDKLISEGVRFTFRGDIDDLVMYPILVSESDSLELIETRIDDEVDWLFNYGKDTDIFSRAFIAFRARVDSQSLSLQHVEVDTKRIHDIVTDYLAPYEAKPADAHIVITQVSPVAYILVSSTAGMVFNYDHIISQITSQWSSLRSPVIAIDATYTEPEISDTDIMNGVLDRLGKVFDGGEISFTYTDSRTKQDSEWTISPSDIAEWLTFVRTDDGIAFGLDASSTMAYIEEHISSVIDVGPQDARFEINDAGKVVEFQGSRPGIGVNIEQTYKNIQSVIIDRTWHDEGVSVVVPVVVEKVEPSLKTGDANDLGITDVLGVGISNFAGSPRNRIANIRNGVQKLNGILVKPGEVFSTIEYTKPYTVEGGYLPELVIKGDEIKPEIGGGLCQIGTTLFRMAMNSGMDITERRNHSLVVSYYNDARNNKPGTDATIYEPAPDFKFKNDTDNYILLQTEMDVNTGELRFTLWGTADGREASYTEPVVHRWIAPGEKKIVETKKLAAGVTECQHAYTGAETSFTYSRTLSDGTKEEEVFSSYYRPLPQICLVGVGEDGVVGSAAEEIISSEDSAAVVESGNEVVVQ
ncbi:MAG: hypothetical protein GW939_03860 [Candidatus Magasanikbacteria bacterium]|uniref:YoaR-like putative peptidoglycan binding domain-containing protein n=1 Tax=Candidatus Magasanikbacteria bacterium CG10_big_fil_rev_8_21_14_0_10_38_6 TaxID=1974647 RepID=A0A2M6P114_9BACT|nr:hypothetical protein [Candidatus Magasanikbacteria bacterium]NCS72442.1 hypothetical protein [Candidatus Magasanikbacteria bacterium]PIR77100.1 MAG: hypothetical protein COU30_04305 [Candidatus Magasanikbacteria bacterium CG10_big_fil_rev_8_21_14_0_10_38_6]